jgi:hypothetical protein
VASLCRGADFVDPVQDRQQIMMMLDQARRQGLFKADYLGDLSGL